MRYAGLSGVWPLLFSRYCLLVPALLLLVAWLSPARQPTAIGNSLAAAALVLLPALALGFVIISAGLDVEVNQQ